ncbi:hypothetical protein EYF80_030584 [Liparis tanakae]|uniref:Uncharacterized protein n=1 Tax=Liparis tanakae TaxID=230148 RepID=A0A4Z2H0U2_9TELE|nr:hypothetical protein EYF80_030584 [Liparis tanakae]
MGCSTPSKSSPASNFKKGGPWTAFLFRVHPCDKQKSNVRKGQNQESKKEACRHELVVLLQHLVSSRRADGQNQPAAGLQLNATKDQQNVFIATRGSPFVQSKQTGCRCRSQRPKPWLPRTAGRGGAPGRRRAGRKGNKL